MIPSCTHPTRYVWITAALIAVAAAFFLYAALSLWHRGLFEYVGSDYRTLWSSALIARSQGFRAVYQLDVQAEFQRPLYDHYKTRLPVLVPPLAARIPFGPIPTPYLPVFVLPLQPFLLLPPVAGHVLWVVFNAAAYVLYLVRFTKATGLDDRSLLISMVLASPLLFTLLFGQTNVWLALFFGEYILATLHGRPFQAGLWLAGMLLKPQTLVLFLPGLFLARDWKTLTGFAVAAIPVCGVSALLLGWTGVLEYVRLLLLYPGTLPTTFPESMMNWRAFALNFASALPSSLAWGLALLGLLATAAGGLALWRQPLANSPVRAVVVALGTYAATCAVAWHSHIHMALPLVVPLGFLVACGILPRTLYNTWLLAPQAAFLVPAFLIGPGLAHNLIGFTLLILNLALLIWAIRFLRSPQLA